MNPLILPDGRTLEVRVSGPEDGLPLVFRMLDELSAAG
jgi:hypothetical protein